MVVSDVLHRHRSFGSIFLGLDRFEVELASHCKKASGKLGAIGSIISNGQSLISLSKDETRNVHGSHDGERFHSKTTFRIGSKWGTKCRTTVINPCKLRANAGSYR